MAYLGKTIEREFYYGADRDIILKARNLRNSMTPGEKVLWHYLRKKKFSGYIFRRQHPISKFIVDFYCHKARLVIEVDGKIHDNPENKEYDQNRTTELENLGLRVIRFKNEDVLNKINKVFEILENEINIHNKT